MKFKERQQIASEIHYQLTSGVHTYSQCSKCDKMSRGGRECWRCLLDILVKGKEVGK